MEFKIFIPLLSDLEPGCPQATGSVRPHYLWRPSRTRSHPCHPIIGPNHLSNDTAIIISCSDRYPERKKTSGKQIQCQPWCSWQRDGEPAQPGKSSYERDHDPDHERGRDVFKNSHPGFQRRHSRLEPGANHHLCEGGYEVELDEDSIPGKGMSGSRSAWNGPALPRSA